MSTNPDRNLRQSTLFIREAMKSNILYKDIFVSKTEIVQNEEIAWKRAKIKNKRGNNTCKRCHSSRGGSGRKAGSRRQMQRVMPTRARQASTSESEKENHSETEVIIVFNIYIFFNKILNFLTIISNIVRITIQQSQLNLIPSKTMLNI